LELAITSLQMLGVPEENILAVAMDKKGEKRRYFDTIHSADGLSLLDLSVILAAFFGIFGGVYGFILEWGPLLWGLIGILVGGLLGFLIKMYTTKKYGDRQSDKRGSEVVLIIECNNSQLQMIKEILWDHKALGVRKLDLDRTQ
jgi:uncharacterized membrane-anchored protein